MLMDGSCLEVNQIMGGWTTREIDDWVYYRQQHVNVTSRYGQISMETGNLVGGCCAPSRFKPTGYVYEDDGSTVQTTGNLMVRVADRPLEQTVEVQGWYLQTFTDDGAVNLTLLPTAKYPDKQSIVYGAAFDRAMIITYQFLNERHQLIGNKSSGLIRNTDTVPDITLPRGTRSIAKWRNRSLHSMAHGQLQCVLHTFTQDSMPIRFLCRQPSHPVLLCVFVMLGSFVFSQAWNMLTSQETLFDAWLPRAAKLIGIYSTLVLFGLRVFTDLPSFVITYAREIPFLVMNTLATIPTLLANGIVLGYFLMRAVKYHPCDRCRIEFLQRKIPKKIEHHIRYFFTTGRQNGIPISKARQALLKRHPLSTYLRLLYRLLGMNAYVRIPYPVKISLTLLIYCLGQLIPVLTTEMLGVGGVVPTFICQWTPYLVQFQYTPDPSRFAAKTWRLMQVAAYFSTFGAGICKSILSKGFTGTLYFMVEIALFGTGIAMLIQLDKFRDYVFRLSGYGVFFASFFVAWIVQLIQKRITRIVFIKKGTRFSLQNRSPLLHYWYFMMLTSMTRALTSYILRTLKLILRYPLFSLRVDRNAETWSVRRGDGGFVGYMGMLLAENEYNNPIMLVFIECILDHIPPPLSNSTDTNTPCQKHSALSDSERNEIELYEASPGLATLLPVQPIYPRSAHWRQIRARTRWFLAYTLINNPMV
ncbi:hypothetical protein CLU79DRAFT_802363 [Phycomyces nitens]|nr:hypothetical protein CLU79DRAFT_802363 [Phycomyces nitens]